MKPADGGNEAALARVGSVLAGKYELRRLLGAGGMGAVYEARHLRTGRRVAVKVMRPEVQHLETLAERFLREARAAARIAHPNIVEVLDLDEDPQDGVLYIVQEFLEGQSLAESLEHSPTRSPGEAIAIVVPAMRALGRAHAEGVIHRDIKPDNIFLARAPAGGGGVVPKVIDFGIAKLTDDAGGAALSLTRTGAAVGTPYYMSPEQAGGVRDIDARTDVWSMGVVLFELLAGRRPFLAETYNQLLAAILLNDAPRLDEVAPAVPRAVADIVARALARDRNARIASMDAFADALEAWAANPTAAEQQAAPAGETPRAEAPASEPPRAADAGPVPLTTGAVSARAIDTPRAPVGRGATARWTRALYVSAAVIVLAGGMLALRRGVAGREPVARETGVAPASAVGAVGAAPPAVPRTFHVVVHARPSAARLRLDGVELEASSLDLELPRDGREHRLDAYAPGFVTHSVVFRDRPPAEQLQLDPVTPPPPPAVSVSVPGMSVSVSATTARDAGRNAAAHARAVRPAQTGPGATAATTAPASRGGGDAPVAPPRPPAGDDDDITVQRRYRN